MMVGCLEVDNQCRNSVGFRFDGEAFVVIFLLLVYINTCGLNCLIVFELLSQVFSTIVVATGMFGHAWKRLTFVALQTVFLQNQ